MRSTLALFGLLQPTLAQYSPYGSQYGSSYSSQYGTNTGSSYASQYGYGASQYGVRTCGNTYNAISVTTNSLNVCDLDETCVSGICLKSRGVPQTPQQSCTVDNDCGPSMTCAGTFCRSSSWQCTRNTDCDASEACLSGTCQPLFGSNPPGSGYWCNVDSQCSVYEKCTDYHCERCQPGECLNRGSLNPCWTDTQCLVAETCIQGLCQSIPCKTDNQCGYTEVCSPTTQTCVDCTSSLTVPGSALAYDPSYYGSTTATCTGTGSGYWCYSDNQCPTNEVCDGTNCRSTGPPVPFQCTSDAQCGYNSRCNAGLCASGQNQGSYACLSDNDCAYNQVCQSAICVAGGYAAWIPHN